MRLTKYGMIALAILIVSPLVYSFNLLTVYNTFTSTFDYIRGSNFTGEVITADNVIVKDNAVITTANETYIRNLGSGLSAGDKWLDSGTYIEPNSSFAVNIFIPGYIYAHDWANASAWIIHVNGNWSKDKSGLNNLSYSQITSSIGNYSADKSSIRASIVANITLENSTMKSYVDAQDSAQDECSEITDCVPNSWDSYSDIPYNSTACTGTDKISNISINSGTLQIICTADTTGAGLSDTTYINASRLDNVTIIRVANTTWAIDAVSGTYVPFTELAECADNEKLKYAEGMWSCITDLTNSTEDMQDSTFPAVVCTEGVSCSYDDAGNNLGISSNCSQTAGPGLSCNSETQLISIDSAYFISGYGNYSADADSIRQSILNNITLENSTMKSYVDAHSGATVAKSILVNGTHWIYINKSYTQNFNASNVLFVNASNKRVGIRTEDPGATFSVSGLAGTYRGLGDGILLRRASAMPAIYMETTAGGDATALVSLSGDLRMYTHVGSGNFAAGDLRLIIESGGEIAINKSSASHTLDVGGTIAANKMLIGTAWVLSNSTRFLGDIRGIGSKLNVTNTHGLSYTNITNAPWATNTNILTNITNHETHFKHGNTTAEVRSQFKGSSNISIIDGVISVNGSFGSIGGSGSSVWVNGASFVYLNKSVNQRINTTINASQIPNCGYGQVLKTYNGSVDDIRPQINTYDWTFVKDVTAHTYQLDIEHVQLGVYTAGSYNVMYRGYQTWDITKYQNKTVKQAILRIYLMEPTDDSRTTQIRAYSDVSWNWTSTSCNANQAARSTCWNSTDGGTLIALWNDPWQYKFYDDIFPPDFKDFDITEALNNAIINKNSFFQIVFKTQYDPTYTDTNDGRVIGVGSRDHFESWGDLQDSNHLIVYTNSSNKLDWYCANDNTVSTPIINDIVIKKDNVTWINANQNKSIYLAGSNLTITGNVIAHADTSSSGSSDNSARTYIQDVLLDGNGHVMGLATATETVTDSIRSEAEVEAFIFDNDNTANLNMSTYNVTFNNGKVRAVLSLGPNYFRIGVK